MEILKKLRMPMLVSTCIVGLLALIIALIINLKIYGVFLSLWVLVVIAVFCINENQESNNDK